MHNLTYFVKIHISVIGLETNDCMDINTIKDYLSHLRYKKSTQAVNGGVLLPFFECYEQVLACVVVSLLYRGISWGLWQGRAAKTFLGSRTTLLSILK